MILLLVTGPAALDAEGPYEAEEPSGPRKPLALRGGRKVVVCLQYAGEGYVQLPPGGQPTDGRCRRAEKLTVQHLPFLSVYIPELDEVISCTFLSGVFYRAGESGCRACGQLGNPSSR